MKNNKFLKLFLAVFTIINFNTLFSAAAGAGVGAAAKEREALAKLAECLPNELVRLSVGYNELVLKVTITSDAAKPIVEMIKIKDTDKISKIKEEIIKRHPNFNNFKLVLRVFNENGTSKILSNADEELPIFRFISLNNPILHVNLEQSKPDDAFLTAFNSFFGKSQQAQK